MSETPREYVTGRDPGDESPAVRVGRLSATGDYRAARGALAHTVRPGDPPPEARIRAQRDGPELATARQSRARAGRALRERKRRAALAVRVSLAASRVADIERDEAIARLAAVTAERDRMAAVVAAARTFIVEHERWKWDSGADWDDVLDAISALQSLLGIPIGPETFAALDVATPAPTGEGGAE